jgi:hypothetical protein
MTEIINSAIEDISKVKKGRPFKIYTVEELEEKNIKKTKGTPGRKAKIYTNEEILSKLDHFRNYQRNYQKGKYVKKEKRRNEIILNHSYTNQFKKYDDIANKTKNAEVLT